ncbi:MAG: ABC transporter permease [Lachnospiraceae bacterium]|nr:ABC transporter permease [Lachnospiraceae bacterium]
MKAKLKKNVVWLMLIALIIIFSMETPYFFTQGNLITILRQVSNTGIITVGMSLVVIGGGIDLSVGTQMGLNGMVTALLLTTSGLPVVICCLIGILLSAFIGFINGTIITFTKMPPLIATLGMSYICKGFAYLITGGFPVYGLPEQIKVLGQGYIGGVFPVCVLILIIVIACGAFVLNKTHFGRQAYAIGSNEEAARLTGVNVNRVRISLYTISGMLAGLSGVVLMSRTNSGQATSGTGSEMDALIACVVGGISVVGGEGNATGIIGGMLVMGVLANGMAVMGMSEYSQTLVKGLVLVAVVALDSFTKTYTQKVKISKVD